MNPLIKYWQITLLVIVLLIALFLIFNPFTQKDTNNIDFTNIKLGLDFKGGTIFTIELQDAIDEDSMKKLISTLSLRIDPTGLQDYTIRQVGSKYVVVEVAETNESKVAEIENRIRQQGKFEANLNGEVVFTGDNIKKIMRTAGAYGVYESGKQFEWSLPFILDEAGAKSFMEKTFHQCTLTTGTTGTATYDCEKTIFFLDKQNAIILIDSDQYFFDEELLFNGNSSLNIPVNSQIDEVIQDAMVPVIIYDKNSFDLSKFDTNYKKVIVSKNIPQNVIDDLNTEGFEVSVYANVNANEPWIWKALNAKQIINLTEGITNEDVATIDEAKIFYELRISGQSSTAKEAYDELNNLTILIESGSLPTPVKSISKEVISPSLGENFLSTVIIMGLIALITVSIVLVLRYKQPILIFPIIIFGMIELLLNIGFLTFTNRPIDLASFAGLIIAIGTGVDSEIVITDELLSKSSRSISSNESIINRAKRAIFIITISALTMIAVMGPIVIFARTYPGIEKLYGFAVVAIVGALLGAYITRPAFTKVVEHLFKKK
ncbi:MAG: hypothetical protein PHQ98_03790 [Candidatus ainarchaeum sp.]|nr:hypothetical protein [Candidatus ainarchaeum sp.]